MNKELKILAINNVTFKKPLSSKKAFKEYKILMQKKIKEDLTHWVNEHPYLDLVENGTPIGVIANDNKQGKSRRTEK